MEGVDAGRTFAVAVDVKASRDCSVEVTAGPPGIAVAVQPATSLAWAWIGTSSWERPNELSWRAIEQASLAALSAEADDGYLVGGSLGSAGLWLGEASTSSLHRLGTTTLDVPRTPDGKRSRLGTAAPAGPGAFATVFRHPLELHALAYVDSRARVSIVRDPPADRRMIDVAVDGARGNSIVWLEGASGSDGSGWKVPPPTGRHWGRVAGVT